MTIWNFVLTAIGVGVALGGLYYLARQSSQAERTEATRVFEQRLARVERERDYYRDRADRLESELRERGKP